MVFKKLSANCSVQLNQLSPQLVGENVLQFQFSLKEETPSLIFLFTKKINLFAFDRRPLKKTDKKF